MIARRPSLPCITDSPKAAFLNGWWSGIGVGAVIGFGAAVALFVR